MKIIDLANNYKIKGFAMLKLVKQLNIKANNVINEIDAKDTKKICDYLDNNAIFIKKLADLQTNKDCMKILNQKGFEFTISSGIVDAFDKKEYQKMLKFLKTPNKLLITEFEKNENKKNAKKSSIKEVDKKVSNFKLYIDYKDSTLSAVSSNNSLLSEIDLGDTESFEFKIDADTGLIKNWEKVKKTLIKILNEDQPKDQKII